MGSGWAFAVPALVAELQKSARLQFHRRYVTSSQEVLRVLTHLLRWLLWWLKVSGLRA